MRITGLLIIVYLVAHPCGAVSQSVQLQYDPVSSQAVYAAGQLKTSLFKQGYLVAKHGKYVIKMLVDPRLQPEAFSLISNTDKITITGGDSRGLLYGTLSLTEDLNNGKSLNQIKNRNESPHLPFRAIKFNLPWEAYREGYAMELHTETCRDVNYWKAFLDMMAENRFNALTLWNLHPFTNMIKPTNFPEASSFSDNEMKKWKDLYHAIFRMAKERGIDTYIVNWNIFVSPAFSKAHNVATNNQQSRIHYGNGDTSEIIKRYTRECVTQVLEEYPDLSGIGFTLGEFMGGMTPRKRQDWINETVIAGMRAAKRTSKLIFRVPLSANEGSGGSTNVETEVLTRNDLDNYDFTDGPIWAEIKFNWSHAHSSTSLIKVHGGKLNDTYFKPEPNNYKIAWMARNEDFFCLRWGVPSFVREHINKNTQSYVGGYFVGSEGYIPAKDYFTKPGVTVNWKYAFERQWLFYKLWGRLLYKPSTPDDVFTAAFTQRYGKESAPLQKAYALVGTVPLRLASSFDFSWDFSLYSEGFMAMNKQNMDYISVERQIMQPSADTTYVSVNDYVQTLAVGGTFSKNKITPPVLAAMLEQDCKMALSLVKNINRLNNTSLMYEVADVKAWANLGLYFAAKLKGAVALHTYRLNGGETNKQEAVKQLKNSLNYWDAVVAITRPIYNDMPLAAYNYPHQGSLEGVDVNRRFHWEKLRPEVARDVVIAENAVAIAAGEGKN